MNHDSLLYVNYDTLIEKDHLGDRSPEKDCCVTDVSTICAEAIFRVKW